MTDQSPNEQLNDTPDAPDADSDVEESNDVTFSLRQATKYLKRLQITNGSVLVVKKGTLLSREKNLEQLVRALEQTSLKDVIVLVAENLTDIVTIPKAEMRRYGWYHFSDVSKKVFVPRDHGKALRN